MCFLLFFTLVVYVLVLRVDGCGCVSVNPFPPPAYNCHPHSLTPPPPPLTYHCHPHSPGDITDKAVQRLKLMLLDHRGIVTLDHVKAFAENSLGSLSGAVRALTKLKEMPRHIADMKIRTISPMVKQYGRRAVTVGVLRGGGGEEGFEDEDESRDEYEGNSQLDSVVGGGGRVLRHAMSEKLPSPSSLPGGRVGVGLSEYMSQV